MCCEASCDFHGVAGGQFKPCAVAQGERTSISPRLIEEGRGAKERPMCGLTTERGWGRVSRTVGGGHLEKWSPLFLSSCFIGRPKVVSLISLTGAA